MRTFRFDFYNDRYNIRIDVEGELFKVNDQFIENNHGRWRLTKYMDDNRNYYYTYGVKSNGDQPGHGGEWSSRTEIINIIFGKNLIECGVNGRAMAIDRLHVELPSHIQWERHDGELIPMPIPKITLTPKKK